jgi:hypothetical protein
VNNTHRETNSLKIATQQDEAEALSRGKEKVDSLVLGGSEGLASTRASKVRDNPIDRSATEPVVGVVMTNPTSSDSERDQNSEPKNFRGSRRLTAQTPSQRKSSRMHQAIGTVQYDAEGAQVHPYTWPQEDAIRAFFTFLLAYKDCYMRNLNLRMYEQAIADYSQRFTRPWQRLPKSAIRVRDLCEQLMDEYITKCKLRRLPVGDKNVEAFCEECRELSVYYDRHTRFVNDHNQWKETLERKKAMILNMKTSASPAPEARASAANNDEALLSD